MRCLFESHTASFLVINCDRVGEWDNSWALFSANESVKVQMGINMHRGWTCDPAAIYTDIKHTWAILALQSCMLQATLRTSRGKVQVVLYIRLLSSFLLQSDQYQPTDIYSFRCPLIERFGEKRAWENVGTNGCSFWSTPPPPPPSRLHHSILVPRFHIQEDKMLGNCG